MKITDKMFEEIINIVKLRISGDQYRKTRKPCKDIDLKRIKIYHKLQKKYNWSNQKLRKFNFLVRELYRAAIMTTILYEINNKNIKLTDKLKENILKDFLDHVTVDILEKDTF